MTFYQHERLVTMGLTQQYIKKILSYNPDTGILIWNFRPESHFKSKKGMAIWNGKYANKIAGCNTKTKSGKSYRIISINSKRYMAHRIIWLIVKGKEPVNDIDHINGDGIDNRIKNLRDVTRTENNKNFKLSKRNKTGFIGVHFDKVKKKYKAEIGVNSKTKFIGYFDTAKEASVAREQKSREYGYHINHGT